MWWGDGARVGVQGWAGVSWFGTTRTFSSLNLALISGAAAISESIVAMIILFITLILLRLHVFTNQAT